MKQITAELYAWSHYELDRRLDVNGHYVQDGPREAGVLIDPVPFAEGDEAHLRDLGGAAAVVLTGAGRAPGAARCARTLGCPVLAPRAVWEALGRPNDIRPFDAGAALPSGIHAVDVPGAPPPGEVALFHPPSRTLVVGSVLVGVPAGQLRLASAASGNGATAARAARGLRALLAFRSARLLLGEGDSLLHEPVRALQDLVYRHDPAACLLRPEEAYWQGPRVAGTRYSLRSAEGARLLGLTAIDFEWSAIAPGCQNYPLHRHDGSEEVFVVLAGEGELRTETDVFPIRVGDVLGFPPRYQVAHSIRNTGTAELRLLAIGSPGAERLEMIDYPASGQRAESAAFGKQRRFFLPERVNVGYWEGTPTD
jgi:uncharacterized cupin superfamily protein